MPAIDIMFSVKGTRIDFDDEWLVLEIEAKKKKHGKCFALVILKV